MKMIGKTGQGRPKDRAGRSKEEQSVYVLLDSLKIPYDRLDHEPLFSMDGYGEIEKALGCPVCKNLFLANRQQTVFYLLRISPQKKFRTKELSSQIHSSRLSFGNEEALSSYLHAKKGFCSILDLRNDEEGHVSLLIDVDLLNQEKIGVHPCANTSTLAISWKDLLDKFLPAIHHGYTAVTLS